MDNSSAGTVIPAQIKVPPLRVPYRVQLATGIDQYELHVYYTNVSLYIDHDPETNEYTVLPGDMVEDKEVRIYKKWEDIPVSAYERSLLNKAYGKRVFIIYLN